MNILGIVSAGLVAGTLSSASAQESRSSSMLLPLPTPAVDAVAPALGAFTRDTLLNEVWNRPDLSRRDRSVVTVAALIARGQTGEMPFYVERALDEGVTPVELSGIVTHLAFYSGFPNAAGAAEATKAVFDRRGITADQLPGFDIDLLPQDGAAEAAREKTVEETVGPVSRGVVEYTNLLFDRVWQRPDLAPRDRSLITVTALIVSGQTGQVGFHLGKAMDNGLTKAEASEVLTHLAFYGGWPNVFSAVPVVREVFETKGN
ncbi:carboxymuconolactone decarboxylase family protein [Aureimonas phyllosphaerae]|uniref:carboxymuconolactone decarboxylase family protein n=1 Tax=Aureimonas phyllosphaerae TaxID=1166078 RepID=UPI003A5B98E7